MKLKIKAKLTLLLLVFGLLPLVIVMPITFEKLNEAKQTKIRHLADSATIINEIIDRNLFERYGDVQAFSLNSAVQDKDNWNNISENNPLINAINGYMVNYGIYKMMLVLDKKGNVIAVNSVDAVGKPIKTENLYDKNFSDKKWFKDAIEGKFLESETLTGTAIGQPYYNELVAEIYNEDGFSIPFSAPIKNSEGKVIGAWVNFADFGLVEQIVREYHSKLNMVGHLFLMAPDGTALIKYDPEIAEKEGGYKRDNKIIGVENFIKENVPGANKVFVDKKGTAILVDPADGATDAVGYAASKGAYNYPGLGWAILSHGEADLVFGDIVSTENLLYIIISVSVISILAIGLLIGNLTSKPIIASTKIAQELSKGNYEVAVPTSKSSDEIGDLLRSFSMLRNATEKSLDLVEKINAVKRSQAFIEFTVDGTILDANENFLNAVGYSLDEIKGKHHSIFVDEAYKNSQDYKKFWQDLAEGKFFVSKFRRVSKSGKNIWIQASYNPILDRNGKPFKVVKFASDITAQVESENKAQFALQNLVDGAYQVNLDNRLNPSEFDGFYKDLASSMNGLMDAIVKPLNTSIEVLKKLSAGDLTHRVNGEFKGSFGEMQSALNETIDNLKDMVSKIIATASNVASASAEISAGSADLSARTEQQASNLEETSASMEQMTASVRENLQNVNQASDLSSKTKNIADKGGESVGKTVTAMKSIEDSSKKIADIISVIDEIAFQTNLLALNAAVEAARAGDAGKGFAVVAEEVRNLAGRSSQASKEIKELISDSVNKVKDGVDIAQKSGESLGEIVSSVNKLTELVTSITNATNEQSTGIEQVNSAISNLDQMTQQNAAMVEQNTASAESLSQQAEELQSMISFFKIDDVAIKQIHHSTANQNMAANKVKNSASQASAKPKIANKNKAGAEKIASANASIASDGWEEF